MEFEQTQDACTVLIPLKSGQVWNQQPMEAIMVRAVLIPLKSGQVWNDVSDEIKNAVFVLIPLKSGQVWNLAMRTDCLRQSCLNPFEIRAGLEPQGAFGCEDAAES